MTGFAAISAETGSLQHKPIAGAGVAFLLLLTLSLALSGVRTATFAASGAAGTAGCHQEA